MKDIKKGNVGESPSGMTFSPTLAKISQLVPNLTNTEGMIISQSYDPCLFLGMKAN
jgi:hypothetical protein